VSSNKKAPAWLAWLVNLPLLNRVGFLKKTHELVRFFKFAAVGGLGAVVDFTVLNLLVLVFGWPKWTANIVSVACALLSNFTWNRHWTFPESRDRPLSTQFGKFATTNLIGLGINQVVFLGTDALVFAHLAPHPLNYNLAKATAIGVVLFWNFFVNRLWTYRGIR
jgi:putative flippase GtrA